MHFADMPDEFRDYDRARVAVLPIPYDGTSTWRKGADRGPAAMLAASHYLELYDLETDSEVYRQGIHVLDPVDCPARPEEMVAAVRARALPVLADGKLLVGLGGEHSVSVGLVQAALKRYPSLSVLQFDAHGDRRDSYQGSPYNHACVMARIAELCPIVQVGIRSMDRSERTRGDCSRMVLAHEIHCHGTAPAKEVLNKLSDVVYITIDLDVLDPAVMPSTGTPEPGGLNWYALTDMIDHVARRRKVIGFDLVELLPDPANPGPDFLAAKLIYRTLSMILCGNDAQ